METIIVALFTLGYLAIAFEHPIKVNKTASALLTGVLCWTIYALMFSDTDAHREKVIHELAVHMEETSEILFFLMGAMTIVELIDIHNGFKIITSRITTRNSKRLLWIISVITFFLAAIIDNLTAVIVMVSVLRKLIIKAEDRKFYACMAVIASNAGGTWSPLGCVTTTMLWMGGQISIGHIMQEMLLPSMVCLLIPLLFVTFTQKLEVTIAQSSERTEHETAISHRSRNIMFFVGIGALISVPAFKILTHLPPYMGMLLGLGVVWLTSEILHSGKDEEERRPFTASHALSRIDTSSILFFLGILIAVGALESLDLLHGLAAWMEDQIANLDAIVILIGIASAMIDNVPLVAAAQGMYDLAQFPMDHKLWIFLSYTAGTGGSLLIIGSAAGVAVMGMERVDFIWYVKRITLLAALGYFGGAGVYLLIKALLF